jgi:type I restriction enzyme S subunit
VSTVPLRYLVTEVDDRAGNSGPLLSVSIHAGVYRRDEVSDDAPRADTLDSYKRCRSGDLVLNRMRAFQGALGVAPIEGLVSPDYAVLRPSLEVDTRFIAYSLRSAWGVAEMVSRLRGIGGVSAGMVRTPRINVRDLLEIRLRVVDRPAQCAIADFLDRECQRIAVLDDRLAAVRDTAEATLLARARELIGFDRYASAQIRYVAQTGTGHTPSRNRPDWWIPEECVIPWFTLADVHQIRDGFADEVTQTAERISRIGLANSSAVVHPSGTVLLSRTASVGFAAVMGTEMAVSQDFMTWTCGPRLTPRYLLHALRADRGSLLGLMHGSTHKTIYMPDLLALRVPLPSVALQQQAVGALDDLTAIHRDLESKIAQTRSRLREYRDALVTEAVTGQLDVTAVSDAQMDEHVHAAAGGAVAVDRAPAQVG